MKQGLNLTFFEHMVWLEDEKGQIKKSQAGIEACENFFTGVWMRTSTYRVSHPSPVTISVCTGVVLL